MYFLVPPRMYLSTLHVGIDAAGIYCCSHYALAGGSKDSPRFHFLLGGGDGEGYLKQWV